MNKTLDRATKNVSEEELAAHLESAQVPALIMLTAHVTGDTSVLRDDWRPNLRALPNSGLDAETEAAARARCFELLAPHLATRISPSRPVIDLVTDIAPCWPASPRQPK